MKIAYFDCLFGAGGDMLLAALLDTGINTDQWLTELSKIALPNDSYKVIIEQAQRCSLVAKQLKVVLNEQKSPKFVHEHDHHSEHEHRHPHSHKHSEEKNQNKAEPRLAVHSHNDQRNFKDITVLISASKISTTAKDLALRIFGKLAQAEAFVHGIDPLEVHFHEVGAIDSIIDIVGFAIAYDMLAIEKAIVSPLPLGSGTVQTQHGLFPVPGPATLQLLNQAKAPISDHLIDYECLTPTAAAILTTIADSWGQAPAMKLISATGCGAGQRNPENYPNICRVIIGESSSTNQSAILNHSTRFNKESITVIETMLDDFSPQNLSFVSEKILELGALDTYVTPVTAKKGRSGHLLTVLCQPKHIAALEELIFEQTSTLGLRVYLTDRLYLDRSWINVQLDNNSSNAKKTDNRISHKIRIKIAKDLTGKIVNAQPEYEDCVQYSELKKDPSKDSVKNCT